MSAAACPAAARASEPRASGATAQTEQEREGRRSDDWLSRGTASGPHHCMPPGRWQRRCWPDDGAQTWLQAIFTDSDSDSVSESHRFGNLTCTSL